MKQRLIQSQRPVQVMVDDCDFEIEPRPDTNRTLDLLIGNGMLFPAVTLRCGQRSGLIVFNDGIDAKLFRNTIGQPREFQEHAKVWFAQEDPFDPFVILTIICGSYRVEKAVLVDELRPFMTFPFEDGEERDPWDLNELDEECLNLLAAGTAS